MFIVVSEYKWTVLTAMLSRNRVIFLTNQKKSIMISVNNLRRSNAQLKHYPEM